MARTGKKRKFQKLVVSDNSYPKGRPPFMDYDQKERYETLHNKKTSIAPLIPSESALGKFGLFEELHTIFHRSGLGVLLDHCEVLHYTFPTLEFLSSFVIDENDAKEVMGWQFRLNGVHYEFSRHDICERLHLPTEGLLPIYSAEIRDTFWRTVSTMDLFCPLLYSRNMKGGVWKYIHQIIAVSVNCRKDRARFITGPDIDCMIAMSKGEVVDWFTIISRRMQDWADVDSKNLGMGGSFFVSLMGISLGIDFSKLQGYPHLLDYKQMIKVRIITQNGTWVHDSTISGKALKTIASRQKKMGKEAGIVGVDTNFTIPMPPTHTVSSSVSSDSSSFDLESRFSALEDDLSKLQSDFQIFKASTSDSLQWLTTSLAGFMVHQGYTSFPPPPSIGSGASTSPNPAPSDGHS